MVFFHLPPPFPAAHAPRVRCFPGYGRCPVGGLRLQNERSAAAVPPADPASSPARELTPPFPAPGQAGLP